MQTDAELREIVGRETRAGDTQDIDLLLSIFHPDFAWPWPSTSRSVDPIDWRLVKGRFNADRWRSRYEEFFHSYELLRNIRTIAKIEISAAEDGAFAVVDIDTLWRERLTGDESNHWLGRTCKIYARTANGWQMTMQTGALQYT